MNEVVQFVLEKNLTLWGVHLKEEAVRIAVYLTAYKDLYGIGYTALKLSIKDWLRLGNTSLQHNTKKIRKAMADWAFTRFVLGSAEDWNELAKHLPDIKGEPRVNLWMDSTDIPLTGKRTVSRKSLNWSYKCNSPGQRYMVITDANMKIRRFWGPYSPKLYDGDFLKLNKQWLEENMVGAVVISDGHFVIGRKLFENLNFVCPKPEPSEENADKQTGKNLAKLSKEEASKNKKIKKLRSRVETPFGILKTKFECFGKPWAEGIDQQGYAVAYAFAMLNAHI